MKDGTSSSLSDGRTTYLTPAQAYKELGMESNTTATFVFVAAELADEPVVVGDVVVVLRPAAAVEDVASDGEVVVDCARARSAVIEIVDERRNQTESRMIENRDQIVSSILVDTCCWQPTQGRGPPKRFSTSEYIDQGATRRRRYLVQSPFRLFADRYNSDRTRGEYNEREIPFGTASVTLGS